MTTLRLLNATIDGESGVAPIKRLLVANCRAALEAAERLDVARIVDREDAVVVVALSGQIARLIGRLTNGEKL